MDNVSATIITTRTNKRSTFITTLWIYPHYLNINNKIKIQTLFTTTDVYIIRNSSFPGVLKNINLADFHDNYLYRLTFKKINEKLSDLLGIYH